MWTTTAGAPRQRYWISSVARRPALDLEEPVAQDIDRADLLTCAAVLQRFCEVLADRDDSLSGSGSRP